MSKTFEDFCREKGLTQADLDVISRELSERVANTTNDEQAKYGSELNENQFLSDSVIEQWAMVDAREYRSSDIKGRLVVNGNFQNGAKQARQFFQELIKNGVLIMGPWVQPRVCKRSDGLYYRNDPMELAPVTGIF